MAFPSSLDALLLVVPGLCYGTALLARPHWQELLIMGLPDTRLDCPSELCSLEGDTEARICKRPGVFRVQQWAALLRKWVTYLSFYFVSSLETHY